HGNGLRSIYNSLEAVETLAEGQSVSKGDLIGYVSDNNRQEYKDGPHLHFEVTLDEEWVDPNDYLLLAEK
ncbi:MAG: M23 family metallopeptidase, partial [Clostridia bacterium]|nr:M23 family metallopeptidase [Clostridia bacterium]